MALWSYFKILPGDFPDPSGPLSSELPSATIVEAKTKALQKWGPNWKLGWQDEDQCPSLHPWVGSSTPYAQEIEVTPTPPTNYMAQTHVHGKIKSIPSTTYLPLANIFPCEKYPLYRKRAVLKISDSLKNPFSLRPENTHFRKGFWTIASGKLIPIKPHTTEWLINTLALAPSPNTTVRINTDYWIHVFVAIQCLSR